MPPTPDELLGVRRDASTTEITAAFRRYARLHHPDRGGDPIAFRAGVEAYRQLVGRPPAGGEVVFFHKERPTTAIARRFASTIRSFRPWR